MVFEGFPSRFKDESALRKILSTFGPIHALRISACTEPGQPVNGSCNFAEAEDADVTTNALNGLRIGEQTVSIRREASHESETVAETAFQQRKVEVAAARANLAAQSVIKRAAKLAEQQTKTVKEKRDENIREEKKVKVAAMEKSEKAKEMTKKIDANAKKSLEKTSKASAVATSRPLSKGGEELNSSLRKGEEERAIKSKLNSKGDDKTKSGKAGVAEISKGLAVAAGSKERLPSDSKETSNVIRKPTEKLKQLSRDEEIKDPKKLKMATSDFGKEKNSKGMTDKTVGISKPANRVATVDKASVSKSTASVTQQSQKRDKDSGRISDDEARSKSKGNESKNVDSNAKAASNDKIIRESTNDSNILSKTNSVIGQNVAATSFVAPVDQPVWEEYFDDNYNMPYYYNRLTDETTWVRPDDTSTIVKAGGDDSPRASTGVPDDLLASSQSTKIESAQVSPRAPLSTGHSPSARAPNRQPASPRVGPIVNQSTSSTTLLQKVADLPLATVNDQLSLKSEKQILKASASSAPVFVAGASETTTRTSNQSEGKANIKISIAGDKNLSNGDGGSTSQKVGTGATDNSSSVSSNTTFHAGSSTVYQTIKAVQKSDDVLKIAGASVASPGTGATSNLLVGAQIAPQILPGRPEQPHSSLPISTTSSRPLTRPAVGENLVAQPTQSHSSALVRQLPPSPLLKNGSMNHSSGRFAPISTKSSANVPPPLISQIEKARRLDLAEKHLMGLTDVQSSVDLSRQDSQKSASTTKSTTLATQGPPRAVTERLLQRGIVITLKPSFGFIECKQPEMTGTVQMYFNLEKALDDAIRHGDEVEFMVAYSPESQKTHAYAVKRVQSKNAGGTAIPSSNVVTGHGFGIPSGPSPLLGPSLISSSNYAPILAREGSSHSHLEGVAPYPRRTEARPSAARSPGRISRSGARSADRDHRAPRYSTNRRSPTARKNAWMGPGQMFDGSGHGGGGSERHRFPPHQDQRFSGSDRPFDGSRSSRYDETFRR